jgi:deoxyribodipyrimidine photo-lyase
MTSSPVIVWFRNDLRLSDNPALEAAVARGESLVLLYVHDEESPGSRPLGSATKWWLHHSLVSLKKDIEALGGSLTLRRGPGAEVVREVVREIGAGAVFWNRRYGVTREADATLKTELRDAGLICESFAGNLLFEPWTIRTGEDRPFRVFTPFWRACLASEPPRVPLSPPRRSRV